MQAQRIVGLIRVCLHTRIQPPDHALICQRCCPASSLAHHFRFDACRTQCLGARCAVRDACARGPDLLVWPVQGVSIASKRIEVGAPRPPPLWSLPVFPTRHHKQTRHQITHAGRGKRHSAVPAGRGHCPKGAPFGKPQPPAESRQTALPSQHCLMLQSASARHCAKQLLQQKRRPCKVGMRGVPDLSSCTGWGDWRPIFLCAAFSLRALAPFVLFCVTASERAEPGPL